MFFTIENNGTLFEWSLPIWGVPSKPNGFSKSYWHRGLHPSPLPYPAPFTSSMFIRTAKAERGKTDVFNTTAFFIYFDELFHDFYAFQYGCLNANGYQNNSKKCKLTPTWFEHAAFWSGVRRATIAPRSPHVSRKIAINVSLVRYSRIFHLKENAKHWKMKQFLSHR